MGKTPRWTEADIPSLDGKVAIVTGGNAGLGFKTSLELARNNATVVIACRSSEKGREAIERIREKLPQAALSTFVLDLNDFDSIRQFSESFQQAHSRLDILVNNAGVVNLKEYQTNQHGYEMHMGTNHVGHFVLTGYLFPLLTSTPGARVVSVTSAAYRAGSIDYKDFDWKHREYSRTQSYGDSKLANLLFAHQLQKKFAECGSDAIVVSAHPGLTGTERQQSIGIGGFVSRWLASSVEEGCRSQLLAATAPFVKAGEFYGPRFGLRGAPHSIRLKAGIVTDELAERLWEYTEQRTGLQYRCP